MLLRPPSLAVGVGASRGASAEEVLGLVDTALATAGLSALSVTALATVDAKAGEPGIQQAAKCRSWPLITYPAPRLAAADVPNPSAAPLAAVGTPSVAEAAALASGGELVVSKRKSAMATAAVARVRPGGAGPGAGPQARAALPVRAAARAASGAAGPAGRADRRGPGWPAAAGHPGHPGWPRIHRPGRQRGSGQGGPAALGRPGLLPSRPSARGSPPRLGHGPLLVAAAVAGPQVELGADMTLIRGEFSAK